MYRRLLSAHILRLLAGIVGMTVAFLLANPTPARAAPIWNDSAGQQVNTINCITLSGEVLGTAYVGWYGDAATPPPVNTVYYVRMWWGVSGNPCTGGARVAPELFLPDGTTLAISATNPVKCFARNFSTGVTTPEIAACPQAPTTGVRGGLGFYPVNQPNVTWPSPRGNGWEIQVPVLSTARLTGQITSPNPTVPCPSCVTAGVWFIDGVNSPWAFPRQGVLVNGPTTPTISYPTPSTSNVTATTASGAATLNRAGTTGVAYIQISDTPPAGANCPPSSNQFPITTQFNVWSLTVNWTGLSPGTTYYWRFCYRVNNITYWGANQLLQTAGTPVPRIVSLSRDIAVPGTTVTINGTDLNGASSVRLIGLGTTQPVIVTPTSVSATAISFIVPDTPAIFGKVTVTTPGGTATSPTTFATGIDTVVDSVQVYANDGSTQKDDVLVRFHATEPFPAAEATCQLDNLPFASSCRSGVFSWSDLAPGNHSVEITAYINTTSGRWTDFTPAIATFTVTNADTTPPNTTITSGPKDGAALAATSVTFAYTSSEAGSTFQCKLDGDQAWFACPTPNTLTGLKQGYHVFAVRAKDKANNVDTTPEYRGFWVDTIPPDTALTSGPANGSTVTSRSATFAWLIINGNGAQCSLDGSAFVQCQAPKTYSGLATGSHTFKVRAWDWAGNVDPTPPTRTWTVAP
jgi:hypothetical protein